jgi:cysteine synthase B
MTYNTILKAVGHIPVAKINCINPNVQIYAKIEGKNPAGPVKDRIRQYRIGQAEKDGI